jgi:hypothetical protein
MPKRLGYKTDACMMLIRREINEHMINKKINKSKKVNDLLLKWYEYELCQYCLGGVIHPGKCEKCGEPWVRCRDTNCERLSAKCDCTWEEREGLNE